ncbi:caspase family protein [Pedobacter sp. MC2016-24]|uniref:caspase family protein n=1 Tax=Pedobacter sp. MC2016-24 TaxID=2780090 RepID=UPI001882124A|nr:caspase family protein [Pedobacter sp. MC2016-24]MBE9598684.1 caspase family protein [Pedobacter sp. MC2016-24]
MNALALVIGNSNYTLEKHKLPNAAKDAIDVSKKLTDLGFTVDRHIDCTGQDFEKAVQLFSAKLKNFAVGLFYFAGHGLQVKGQNYLTAINTRFEDELSAQYSSYNLAMILDYMDRSKSSENSINIVVLDACRDNPWNIAVRSLNQQGLAPVFAPKGTIIAYSTSPGQTAKDGIEGTNSVYAEAFLNHIDDTDIPIEEFFKRVRTSVYDMTDGKQTSWEHTSLIGNFNFNGKDLNHSVNLPYSHYGIADKYFVSNGNDLQEIILQMRIYNWDSQNSALRKFKNLSDIGNKNTSDLFLMGRNILQAAHGGEWSAMKFMANPSYWLPSMATDDENHVLNGILFEMYFNNQGRFRQTNFKNNFLDEIYLLEDDIEYASAFNMIGQHLKPFKNYIFYKPGSPTVPIEIKFENYEYLTFQKKLVTRLRLASVKHQGFELLDKVRMNEDLEFNFDKVSFTDLKKMLSKLLMVPLKKLRFSTDRHPVDNEPIVIPYKIALIS